jgi:Flp pilus assembly protein TadG
MTTILRKLQTITRIPARYQKGQVLIIVTLAIVGIVAIVGLALDVGITFVEYARLRRAVDAAALAAALQYRIGATTSDLDRSAVEFLVLNGVNDPSATVDTCATLPSLCTTPSRKLVQVVAHATAHLAFLPVIGISTVPLDALAQSEAASVDVVLVIDTSESMTFDAAIGNPARDPNYCNNPVNAAPCQPFQGLKDAAKLFVSKLFFPYDRVAIIDFNKTATDDLDWSSDAPTIDAAIDALQVYQAGGVCPAGFPCRKYTAGHDGDANFYLGFDCPGWHPGADPEECTTTNTGAGLLLAGDEFAVPPVRQDALWVTILLTDGAANSGGGGGSSYACPPSTYLPQPFCRNPNALIRHCSDAGTMVRCTTTAPAGEYGDPLRLSLLGAHGVWPGGGLNDPANWDAMDYARDMADFVYIDQHSLIFTIGLGSEVTNTPFGTPNAGELFLKYTARDGEPEGGQYYFAPSGAQLGAIFQSIADNIATRLNK